MSQRRPDKPPETTKPEVARWVTEMHVHYNQTGFYRSEDVKRVLGDPSKGVDAPASTEAAKNGRF